MRKSKAIKSKYTPKNPTKYRGNVKNIVCRSSWERFVCRWLDGNKDVFWWSSEEIHIWYRSSVKGYKRRYFPDFMFETKDGTYIIEVKPDKETRPPAKPKRQTKRYLSECATYVTNQEKWEAAQEYADSKGFQFHVWTEKHLKKMGWKSGY